MSKKYNSMGFGRDVHSHNENLRSSSLGSYFKTKWLMSLLLLCGMLFTGFNASAQISVTATADDVRP